MTAASAHEADPKSARNNVRSLDLLTYIEKLEHWDGADPWRPAEGCYRFQNPKYQQFHASMVGGNITSMPRLIGRPCFGIITALLRYRHAQKYVKGVGLMPNSRCGPCRVRHGCERVVQRRLQSSPSLKAAYEQFLLAEGPTNLQSLHDRSTPAGRAWAGLSNEAKLHPFTSSNDSVVAAHYAEIDRNAEARALEKASAKRRARFVQGHLDSEHVQLIQASVARRARRLVTAINMAKMQGGPKSLSQLSKRSVRELLDVWEARETLTLERKKVTAASIARWIVAQGRPQISKSMNALGTRVRKDLNRIALLETMLSAHGEAVLPRLDPKTELT